MQLKLFEIVRAELKALLSGHVNYKKPLPNIKIERSVEDEQVCSFSFLLQPPVY